jgi:stage V sporulation protein G
VGERSVEITEIRVKLMHNRTDRLRAFCSITIDDDFVVHDLRVIEGRKGLFVAMPSRKLTDNCPKCGSKNELRSKYCSDCGQKLGEKRAPSGAGRDKLHVDVAHPINTPCREELQERVLEAYREEEENAQEASVDAREAEEPSEPARIDEEYDGFEEESAGDEAEPVEEQADVPVLEGEPASFVPDEFGQSPPDLAPTVESEPEEEPAGSVPEQPDEFGEVTAEGETVMPSEPPEGAGPEDGSEDAPEGAAGTRRSRRREREKGGFGKGIL